MVMHHEGVDMRPSTKEHEQELKTVFEPFHTRPSCKQGAKRSFRRARNRAKQPGYTGLCPVSFGGQQQRSDNAVPTLGQSTSMPPADRCSGDSDCSGLQEHPQHSEVDGGQPCDAEISRSSEDPGRGSIAAAGSVAVGLVTLQQPGASAAISGLIASRHLATHTGEAEATDLVPSTIGGAASEIDVRFGIVRLFINPSGRACAAISVIECLAWLMLLAGGFVYEQWRCGFELMRNIVSNNLIPLDLLRHESLQSNYRGHWQPRALRFEPSPQSTTLCFILDGEPSLVLAGHWTDLEWTAILISLTSSHLHALAAATLHALCCWRLALLLYRAAGCCLVVRLLAAETSNGGSG